MKLSTIILVFISSLLILLMVAFDQQAGSLKLSKSRRRTLNESARVNLEKIGYIKSKDCEQSEHLHTFDLYEDDAVESQPEFQSNSNNEEIKPSRATSHRCIFGCIHQTSTSILLFIEPGRGQKYKFRVTKQTSPDQLRNSGFDPQNPTILMIHGFLSLNMVQQGWPVHMKDMVLSNKRKRNVLYADWNHHSWTLNYAESRSRMPEVAQDIYDMLKIFESTFSSFKMTNIQVLGHSLGAHIGGILGQLMGGELDQITGLEKSTDPAGVSMESASISTKLTPGDAKYVVAHHTDSNYLGTIMGLADRDIYFNGGDQQPACWFRHKNTQKGIVPFACDHKLSPEYISVYYGKCIMVAYLCSSYKDFESGECGFCASDSDSCIGVGNEWQYENINPDSLRPSKVDQNKSDTAWIDTGTKPKYYLKTGSMRPYCMVKFPDSSNPKFRNYFELSLRTTNPVHKFKTRLSNRLAPDKKVEVYSESGSTRSEIISGKNVFVGMASIEKHGEAKLYDKMPVKFTEAILPQFLADQVGSAEVFLNFMSHASFEDRAVNSGPAKVKWGARVRVRTKNMRKIKSH